MHQQRIMLNTNSRDPALDLLVIGGASLDVYHLADGQTVHSPGGAGLYTTLAAHQAGAHVGMFAPRPDPLPAELQPAADRLTWIGPAVPPDQLPHFEIAHYGGGRAALLNAAWGGEMLITPENFPDDLSARIIHIAALRTAERQLNFAKTLRTRNFQSPISNLQLQISAGTYGKICASEPDAVRELIRLCDFFFMNENEAALLFGGADKVIARTGQLIFITLNERGALVLQGDHVTHVPGHPTAELDPTGAGDTFCGATLAHLAHCEHPIRAAQSAVMLAAEMIGAVGPTRLLSDAPAPQPALDPRVRVDATLVERIARLIEHLPEVRPFDFAGDLFPPIEHPRALDFFFAATLQQFGFWSLKNSHGDTEAQSSLGKRRDMVTPWLYAHPLIASIEGRALKGSDYLFAAYRRVLDRDADCLTPERQAALTAAELADVFRDDSGANPMPAFDLHLQQAQAYGRDMQTLGWRPQSLIDWANRSTHPRATLLSLLDQVGGYKEDPLRKKAMLLVLILEQRPEQFLRRRLAPWPAAREQSNPIDLQEIASSQKDAHLPRASQRGRNDSDAEPPVIDYHLMRSCLRTGLVEVVDDALRSQLIGREELSEAEEWAVRFAAYQAIQQVQVRSGRSMGAVDWFFFNARRRCPEMTEPECAKCAIDPVCVHRKTLFQPVRRTTFY